MLLNVLQVGFVLGDQTVLPPDVNNLAISFTKILFVIGALLYVIFSVIVTRQIHIMKSTVQTTFSPVVQMLGYAHLTMSVLVLIFFVLFL